jgi:hypothetical protein
MNPLACSLFTAAAARFFLIATGKRGRRGETYVLLLLLLLLLLLHQSGLPNDTDANRLCINTRCVAGRGVYLVALCWGRK